MEPIRTPFGRDNADDVRRLQAALLTLVERGRFVFANEDLLAGLRKEQESATFGEFTSGAVTAYRKQGGLSAGADVDEAVATSINRDLREQGLIVDESLLVRGQIVDTNGRPLAGASISVSDRDLGLARDQLGSAITSERGEFAVPFTRDAYIGGDVHVADLMFEIVSRSPDHRETITILAIRRNRVDGETTSPYPAVLRDRELLLGVPARPVEDLTIVVGVHGPSRDLSEFEQLVTLLGPLLERAEYRSPGDMDEDACQDVTFAARELDVDRQRVADCVSSYRLAADAIGEAFPSTLYGLARAAEMRTTAAIARATVDELVVALQRASTDPANWIPPFESEHHLRRVADAVQRWAKEATLLQAAVPNAPSLTRALDGVGVAAAERDTLMAIYARHAASPTAFWRDVAATPAFSDPDRVARLQLAMQLEMVGEGRPAFTAAVTATGTPATLRGLALDPAAVQRIAATIPGDQLTGLPGTDVSQQQAAFGARVEATLQAAFPTETVAMLMASSPRSISGSPSVSSATAFLLQASDPGVMSPAELFDIRTSHVGRYVARHGGRLLSGMKEDSKAAVVAELKRTQRVFAISASPQTFARLLETKLDSAHAIAQIPRSVFISGYQDTLGGVETAALIHGRATSMAMTALAMAVNVKQSVDAPHPAVLGERIKVAPTWAELFGGAEMCECRHCTSVLGPAAYFVDLLEFLRAPREKSEAGYTPLDYLIGNVDGPKSNAPSGRRPDLAHILLNCENTDTSLPYVDLVNEVLESYVADRQLSASTAHDVQGESTADLLAAPQHINQHAYDLLRDAWYPIGLPFDRELEVSRRYFDKLGTSRLEALRAFAPDEPSRWSSAMVAEALALSKREYEIITGSRFDGTPAGIDVDKLFGFDGTTTAPLGRRLRPVRFFLARTNISYPTLVDVLRTRFVNPDQAAAREIEALGITEAEREVLESSGFTTVPATVPPKLAAAGHTLSELKAWLATLKSFVVLAPVAQADPECDLDRTELVRQDRRDLSDDTLLDLHRFIRLRKVTGLAINELDALLDARQFKIDPAKALREIAQALRIARKYDIDPVRTLSLWSNIDTFGQPSLYTKLFESPSVGGPNSAFRLNVARSEIARAATGAAEPLRAHLATIASALRVQDQELSTVVANAGLGADPKLTLANLSRLHRYALLARGLGAPLRLILELRRLSPGEADPFTQPLATLEFAAMLTRVQGHELTASQLAYWCRDDDPGSVMHARAVEQAQALSEAVFALLQKTEADDRALLVNPTASQMRAQLALALAPGQLGDVDIVTIAAEIVEGTSKLPAAARRDFVKDPQRFARFAPPDVLLPVLEAPLDPEPLKREEQLVARRRAVLTPLLPFLRRLAIRQLVAAALGVAGEPLAASLLEDRAVIHDPESADAPMLNAFVTPQQTASAARVGAFRRLAKAVEIIAALRLSPAEVRWLTASGELDLNVLPLSAGDGRAPFASLIAAVGWAELRARYPGGADALLLALQATSDAARDERVALALGMTVDAVKEIRVQGGLSSASYGTVVGLRRVLDARDVMARSGLRADKLVALVQPSHANEVAHTLKARLDEQSWLSVAREISDALRGRQRDALVAYLLTMPHVRDDLRITSADQLYEWLLIDVQMDACMQTSRLKQAISSVQLFVQRCLLNLEADVRPSAIDASQWEWRKNYRVWEAARRVFLYPENYCEAELRDDKTPFFKELESELLQGDLSDAAAEQAYFTYATKLEVVAKLETCAFFLEEAADPRDNILHVVARTRIGAPREYYYRRWVGSLTWTPWERIDLEIDGKEDPGSAGVPIIPFVWRGTLYLFWAVMSVKSEEAESREVKEGAIAKKPPRYWEVRLAWSTYKLGRWTPKRVTSAIWESDHGGGGGGRGSVTGAFWGFGSGTGIGGALNGPLHQGSGLGDLYGPGFPGDPGVAPTPTAGSAFKFRLFAVDRPEGLQIVVVDQMSEMAGWFSLANPYDEMVVYLRPWNDQNLISVFGTQRRFNTQVGSGAFSLRIPAPGFGPITRDLLTGLSEFRATVTSQTWGVMHSLSHPAFLETFDASYFMASRAVVEWVPDVHTIGGPSLPSFGSALFSGAPAPGLLEDPATLFDADRDRWSARRATGFSHPWTSAALALAPTALSRATVYSGTTIGGSVLASPGASDGFLEEIGVRVPMVQVPSLQVVFQTAFHPYAREFVNRIKSGGVANMLSLDTQSLGNPQLRAPWIPGYVVSTDSGFPATFIEGTVGFNPAASLPGNFEAAIVEAGNLIHAFHISANVFLPWMRALKITDAVLSAASLVERVSTVAGQRGTFEVVVRRSGGLEHFSWPAGDPPSWTGHGVASAAAVGAGCLIESDYETSGARSLELLVPESTSDAGRHQLAHYRLDNADGTWKLQEIVTERTVGAAAVIQSSFTRDGHGRLEALVLEPSPVNENRSWLVHYWKDATDAGWTRGELISQAAAGASFVQSRIQDSQTHGNFDAVVLEGRQAVHYWRDNSVSAPRWRRGQVISSAATAAPSIVQSHYGGVGNFEVIVPEGSRLQHYWLANEGPADSVWERFFFRTRHQPTALVGDPLPRHDVDFSATAAYGIYNWELFVHLPLLIASRLTRLKRFPDALKWFRRVFDSTVDSAGETPHRFWRALPLQDDDRTSLERMFRALQSSQPEDAVVADEMRAAIRRWQSNPFMPHQIARVRPSAYKKHIVVKVIECLCEWGEQLHRQAYAMGSIERLNEAGQIYVMAAAILGPRPETVPRRTKPSWRTYDELRKGGLDEFSNAIIELENEFPFSSETKPVDASGFTALFGIARSLYFCLPKNDRLLGLWDRVEDRLYKLRHCMDLEGVVRQLPLFEPPIDPMMLVQAAAQGISIATAVSALGAPLPPYRFSVALQKALDLCAEVKALGAQLLSIIERRDGEALARLRAGHETAMQKLVHTVRQQQREAAGILKSQLIASRAAALARWSHYQQMLGENNKVPAAPTVKSRVDGSGTYHVEPTITAAQTYQPSGRFELVDLQSVTMGLTLPIMEIGGAAIGGAVAGPAGAVAGAAAGSVAASVSVQGASDFDHGTKILSYEKDELVNSFQSTIVAATAGVLDELAGVLSIVPSFSIDIKPLGVGGSVSFGGSNLASAASAASRALQIVAATHTYNAGKAARQAAFVLREREWGIQNNVAALDLASIDHQIVHAAIQIDIADREMKNLEVQIEDSKAIDEFLHSKFSSEERYDLMKSQLLDQYFAAYELALDAARSAERCYRFERGVGASAFVAGSGYWDDASHGLMAGERLSLALRQMEQAFLAQNVRELEITKHVSLVALDPLQLVALKETGTARIHLPEALFDLDHPGQYMRRLRSVSVTIPCVTGPYTGVPATLRLMKSRVRFSPDDPAHYAPGPDDKRFVSNFASTRAVAISSAQNDSGVFDLNIRDDRYLPFEGEGAESIWELAINTKHAAFDPGSITNVVLHVRYTAREGGARLRKAAEDALDDALKAGGFSTLEGAPGADDTVPVARLFSLRHEFPNEWHDLTQPVPDGTTGPVVRKVTLPISKERLPYLLMTRPLVTAKSVSVLAVGGPSTTVAAFGMKLTPGTSPEVSLSLTSVAGYGKALFASSSVDEKILTADVAKPWVLELSLPATAMKALTASLRDLLLVVSVTG